MTLDEQVEEVFLSQVRESHPNLEYTEGDSMIEIAKSFCVMFDNGAESSEINDFILIGAGVAYSLTELLSIYGAGVAAFCPEHVEKI